MDYRDHVRATERESSGIVAALRSGTLEVNVPTCPEWTLVDLGTHLGQFCGFWSHVLCEAKGHPKGPYTDPDPGERRAEWFAAWFEEQAAQLVDLLKATDHGQAVWTWIRATGRPGSSQGEQPTSWPYTVSMWRRLDRCPDRLTGNSRLTA